ncbi:GNAT family N-acetyltransferase [uncultured Victivallis sp.]|uniref:GNAT family N-acetyltransferase n=1 Tax=uncultured Victivallis sp. TaxID=354118 RepID=UPI0025CD9978|nr:GNAT family N-acetyltransferase [uncultured Victivallis sp.]
MSDDFSLTPLNDAELPEFKREMQRAFQLGYEAEFGPCDKPILPEEDIDQSLEAEGAVAYAARIDGVMAGGAVVKINRRTRHNELELLFVKAGTQSRGIGQNIWNAIEKLYPDTEEWETFTPYFEKRNIHFYVNRCGFRIVEFFNPRHKLPLREGDGPCNMADEAANYFFRFVKPMKPGRD